jgi:methionyl-tRNA formyltransferase
MNTSRNIIALGRSRYLYDSIKYLASKGFSFKAIVTEQAYDEYDIKEDDFRALADELGIPCFVTRNLNVEEIVRIVKEQKVRAAISANWRVMIPDSFIDLFECGILNFHLGSLPDYKGNAVANWTIINGEDYINGTIHKLTYEMDAGDIVATMRIPINEDTYIKEVLTEGARIAPLIYEKALDKLFIDPSAYEIKGTVRGLHCYPRLPEDSQINWQASAIDIGRLIRASSQPYSGAFTFLNNEKIIIWKAKPIIPQDKILAMPGHVIKIRKDRKTILVACGHGFLEIEEIEYQGKVMAPTEFIKSIRLRLKYLANAGN